MNAVFWDDSYDGWCCSNCNQFWAFKIDALACCKKLSEKDTEMKSLESAVAQMNNLPDISGQDSETLQYFSRTTARELKVGGVTAGTSIQMIGYIRSLEMQLRGQSQGLPDEATCPDCGEIAAWQPCKYCKGAGTADCQCEGAGGRWFCPYGCENYK